MDALKDGALVRVFRVDDRAVLAALHRGGFQVKPQSAFLLIGAMTSNASTDENRLDVLIKVDGLRSNRRKRQDETHANQQGPTVAG